MKKLLILLALITLTTSGLSFGFNAQQKAAVVQFSGSISTSSSGSVFSGGGGITPEGVRSINDRIESQGYDAVLYEINSGGGTVVASKEVMREINSLDVPTVCRFRDVAASGAYLFSLGCDRIVADSATITGSIGVKSSFVEFSEALEENGLEYINISSGKYKEVGSPYLNASMQDKQILRENSEQIHDQFIALVESNRNLSNQSVEEVRTGKIILGSDAQELGLVDTLGGRETAKNVTEELAGEEMRFETIGEQEQFSLLSLFAVDTLFEGFFASSESPIRATI